MRETLRFVAANVLQSVLASTLTAVALVIFLWSSIVGPRALSWLAALIVIGVLRLAVRRQANRAADASSRRRRLQQFMYCALANGLVWASAPWMLDADGQAGRTVLLLACIAIGGGGAFASLASLRTAFAIFLPPMLAPVLYGLLAGDGYFIAVAGATLVLSLALARMLVVLNRQFVEQVELRERNATLLLELRQRTADAEAANEAKSRFLVAASHDLRQPMHAIAIRSHALLQQALPPEAHAIALRLDQSVAAMQGLFDALLDISRLDAGTAAPAIAPSPLAPLFDKLRDGYADLALEQQMDFEVEPTTLWAVTDVTLLERMLRQLIENAMRHAAHSSAKLGARVDGDTVVIEVRDAGSGIPREAQQRIFKEFVQLGNPERDRRKGLGLGLTIVERLARQLGHRLELESEPGQGACFRILAPLAAPASAAAPAPGGVGTSTAAPAASACCIGLLDDDPDVLDAMQILLLQWGHQVAAATHSDELDSALARLARAPDLVICDYRLAEPRNGLEVIDALRARYGAALPALLITGDIRAAELAAVDDLRVLRKPVPPDVLRDAIAAARARPASSR